MMPPPMLPSAVRLPLRLAAVLAVWILALGLPRFLVLCEHDGTAHLEFAHAPGTCCDDGSFGLPLAAAADDDHDGERALAFETCSHRELAFEVAPAPRTEAPTDVAPPPSLCELDLALPPPARDAPPRPPATGPPRPDAHAALRATTQLLL